MLVRSSKPYASPGINVGLFHMKVFIQCALIESWFMYGFGLADFLFDFRVGIGVRKVVHFLRNSLQVTLLEGLRRNFVKLSVFIWTLLSYFFQDFSCVLKILVTMSRSATLPLNLFFIYSASFKELSEWM